MEGLLLVNKPKNWSSFDVVGKTRSIIAQNLGLRPRQVKVGHTGTLDPIATGLMVVLIGKKYTKMSNLLIKNDKQYVATAKLGYVSPSYDIETETKQISSYKPTLREIEDVLKHFIGDIEQTPPIYSAIKIDGKRAYKLARENKTVEIKPRKVKISSIEILEYSYPELKFIVDVSSGTYIRTLIDDIGKKLETGAVMTDLNRTKIGKYSLDESITSADAIDFEYIKNNIKVL